MALVPFRKTPPGVAAGADLHVGGDEDLHGRVGADDCADVAAVEHGAWLLARKITLKIKQGRPDRRELGDHGRGIAQARQAEAGVV